MTETELLRLALFACEAGADPSLWPDFLKAYAEALNADVTALQVHHFKEHRSDILATHGMASRFRASYHEYYSKLNVWREHGQSSYVQGRVMLDEETYPKNLLKASEFYNDYLLPIGVGRSMAGVIKREENSALVLTTLRHERRKSWETSDKKVINFLLPHLMRANIIQQKLWIFQAGEIVLNSIPLGVVLLNAEGKVAYTNRAAEAILQANDGLSLKSGVLAVTMPETGSAIRHAVKQAVALDVTLQSPSAVLVERDSMRRSYQLVIAPLRRKFPEFAGLPIPAAMVLVTDPEQQPNAAVSDLIRELYGLTQKEAELAHKLCAGVSLEQAANELQIQYETARTHLRRVFSKTGTSRQAELVSLLGRLHRPMPD